MHPDFYEWWPQFCVHELKSRLERMDVHLATLLTSKNLSLYAELDSFGFASWARMFRQLSNSEKCGLVIEVLRAVGINEEVTLSIGSIDRSKYLPYRYRHAGFLNLSIPLGQGSNATMFGLTALVTDAAKKIKPKRIIEVGFGSGLQAAGIMAIFLGEIQYVGYELNQELKKLWFNGASLQISSKIEVRWEAFNLDKIKLKKGDMLLFSCSLNREQYKAIRDTIRNVEDVSYLIPRPLLFNEFEELSCGEMLHWNGQIVNTDEQYCLNPRAYMILTLGQVANGILCEYNVCNNIQYVKYQTELNLESFSKGKLSNNLETTFCD